MYIYIHVENFAREFDAKLLLSILALKKNIKILLGDVNKVVQKKNTPRGIFHNKDITASKEIIEIFKNTKKNKILITSQDEEGGIERETPEFFAIRRYSSKTFKLVDKVFTFGKFDTDYLKNKYPIHKDKIVNTGSPRFDFYKPMLNNKNQKKKFILISSNFATSLERRNFWDRIKIEKNAWVGKFYGSKEEKRQFDEYSHNNLKIYEMIRLVRYLTEKYKKEKFIFRPHPIESIDGWKTVIGERKNLEVIRDGTLVDWIYGAKILIQSGCYSAIEASLAGTNIITFQPFFDNRFDKYFPSSLGYYCKNVREVDKKFSVCLKNSSELNKLNLRNLKKVKKRLNFYEKRMTSYEIVKIWDELSKNVKMDKSLEQKFDRQLIYQIFLFKVKNFIKKIFFTKDINKMQDAKFPPLDVDYIEKRKNFLLKKLKIDKEVKIKQINNHLCLIKL